MDPRILLGSKRTWQITPHPFPVDTWMRHMHKKQHGNSLKKKGASLVSQLVKNLPAMWDTWVRSLGWEDPLEEGMATHSNILAWKIPWTGEPGGLQSIEPQSRTQLSDSAQHIIIIISPRGKTRCLRLSSRSLLLKCDSSDIRDRAPV